MGFVRHLTGKTAARGAERAGDVQQAAAEDIAAQTDAIGQEQVARVGAAGQQAGVDIGAAGQQAGALFDPFAQLGQQGIDQAGFLTDPNAQFDFLQNNPLFQMGLDNANTQTNQMAAARGRLTAGDTLQQLSQNALLTASPLIEQQKQAIQNQLSMGQSAAANQANLLTGTAGQQANLLTGTAGNQANLAMGNQATVGNLLGSAAAAQAAGIVGAANAKGAGASSILNIGSQLAGSLMPSFGGGQGVAPPTGTSGGIPGTQLNVVPSAPPMNLNLSSQPVFDSSAWGKFPGGT